MIKAEEMFTKVNSQISEIEVDVFTKELLTIVENRLLQSYNYQGDYPNSYTEVIACNTADIIGKKAVERVVAIIRDNGYIVSEIETPMLVNMGDKSGLFKFITIRIYFM